MQFERGETYVFEPRNSEKMGLATFAALWFASLVGVICYGLFANDPGALTAIGVARPSGLSATAKEDRLDRQ
jgi:hypothetical protein